MCWITTTTTTQLNCRNRENEVTTTTTKCDVHCVCLFIRTYVRIVCFVHITTTPALVAAAHIHSLLPHIDWISIPATWLICNYIKVLRIGNVDYIIRMKLSNIALQQTKQRKKWTFVQCTNSSHKFIITICIMKQSSTHTPPLYYSNYTWMCNCRFINKIYISRWGRLMRNPTYIAHQCRPIIITITYYAALSIRQMSSWLVQVLT